MTKFNKFEVAVIQKLYAFHRPMTVYEIAKESKFTIPTIKKYADKLVASGHIKKVIKKGGKRTHYQFHPEVYEFL